METNFKAINSEYIDMRKKFFEEQTCIMCEYLGESKNCIKSHTVSKSLFKFIGADSTNQNQVYEINKFSFIPKRAKQNHDLTDYLIREAKQKIASTYPLFCNKHDVDLFSNIENNYDNYAFLTSQDLKEKNNFLLGYRAICYARVNTILALKKLHLLKQYAIKILKDDYNKIKYFMESQRKILNQELNIINKELSIFNIYLDKENFKHSFFYSIKYDLKNHAQHNLIYSSILVEPKSKAIITINNFPINDKQGYFLLQWLPTKKNNDYFKRVVGNLWLEDNLIEQSIHRMAFNSTNIFSRISWEDKFRIFTNGLTSNDKVQFLKDENIFNNWENIVREHNFDINTKKDGKTIPKTY